MSLAALTAANQDYFRLMELTPEISDLARDCVLNYSMPDDCSGIIAWIIFRVVNAVKAIFGVSDWQMARNAVQSNTLAKAYERGLIEARPHDPVEIRLKARVIEFVGRTAEDFLDMSLTMQADRAPSDDGMRARLENISRAKQLEGIERMVTNVRNA